MSKTRILEPLHVDFQKILTQFQQRYGSEKGLQYFWAWVSKLGLNPDKAYGWGEKFGWIQPFQIVKVDKGTRFYRVEAAFPLSSMNRNVYTEFELERAARTLVGKSVNLNHEGHVLKGVTVEDAEYEGGAVEVLIKVLRRAGHGLGLNIQSMIKSGEIVHVSIEASCRRGVVQTPDGLICKGLNFTGLALLTKDALPGVPLTRVLPVEAIVEGFHVKEVKKMENKEITGKTGKQKSKTNNATEKIAGLNFQVSELKRKFQQVKEECEVSASRLQIKEKEFNELQVSNAKLERQVDTVNAKLEQLNDVHERLLKQHGDVAAESTRLQTKYQELNEEHKRLVQESEHTQQLLAQEQQAHYDASTEKIQLTQQLTERNNEILKHKTEIQGLRQQLMEQNRENTELQNENKQLTDRVKKAKRLGRIVLKV